MLLILIPVHPPVSSEVDKNLIIYVVIRCVQASLVSEVMTT